MTSIRFASGALIALALAAETALAQSTPPGDGPVIVVEAPRSVPMKRERNPYTGAPIVVTTVRIPALYGDLNLARPADAARLTTRLNRVAHDACAQLDQLYPLIPDEDCVSRAVRGANPQVRAAIAKAQKKSHKS